MSYLCPHCNSFPLEDYDMVGLWVKNHKEVERDLWRRKYNWKQPNMLLVVQTGESIDQGKVFRAHAAPQGLVREV